MFHSSVPETAHLTPYDESCKMLSRKNFLLYSIPFLVALIIFQNHYARDTVGALEKQLESDIPITPGQYSTLNSIFFVPNIFAPLFVGFLIDFFGGPAQFMIYAVIISSLGHLMFAFGAQVKSIPLFYFGRFIAGTIYEVIDTIPINFLGPLFKQNWGMISGLLNGFLRLGSVFSFLLNPYFYQHYGVTVALWASGLIVLSGVFAAIGSNSCQKQYHALQATDSLPAESSHNPMLKEKDSDKVDVVDQYNTILKKVGSGEDVESLGRDRGAPSNGITHRSGSHHMGDDEATAESRVSAAPDSAGAGRSVMTASGLLWTAVAIVARYLPVHEYGSRFHFYNLGGMFLYGAMVPFWFIGSKFIQINYNMSVGQADSLMLLPEGAMTVISPLLGYVLDKSQLGLRAKLTMLALSCMGLTLSYLLLAFGYRHSVDAEGVTHFQVLVSPILSMLILGVSYAFSNSLLWTSIILVIEERHLASASGLVASCMNVLPSVLPHVILGLDGALSTSDGVVAGGSNVGLFVLSVTAVCAAACSLVSSLSPPPSASAEAASVGAKPLAPQGKPNVRLESAQDFDPLDDASSHGMLEMTGGAVKQKTRPASAEYAAIGTGDFDE